MGDRGGPLPASLLRLLLRLRKRACFQSQGAYALVSLSHRVGFIYHDRAPSNLGKQGGSERGKGGAQPRTHLPVIRAEAQYRKPLASSPKAVRFSAEPQIETCQFFSCCT